MPDPRCPAVRALTAAATLFLCVSHASAPGGQAAGGPDAAATVLACQVAQSLPVPPAEAREGGFAFVFESLGGTAADGRACTAYRLRNLPGSPPTPVRWAAGSEVLVDVARLARCPRDQECPWLEVARYFDGDFVGGETTIGYGLNADSFHVTSPGLVAFSSPDVGAAAASVGTEVAGTVVDSQGRAVALELVVKSRFERGEDGLTLVYEATADDPTQLDGTRFVLAWEAFDLLPGAADAAVTGPSPFRAAATGAFVPVTHRAPGAVSVRVPAGGAAYRDLLTLTVGAPGAGGADLLTVVLPAFLPRP